MKRRCVLMLVAVLSLTPLAGAAVEPLQFSDPAQEARYLNLITGLRCLVCQNQSIAESDAPLAADLRHEIHKMIQNGASDREVVDFLVARYGDFILFRPPFKPKTYLLWFGPLILLILGLAVFIRVMRRRTGEPAPELTDDERQRLGRLFSSINEEKRP